MKQVYDLGEAALTLIHPCLTLRSEADLCLLETGLSSLNRLANSMGKKIGFQVFEQVHLGGSPIFNSALFALIFGTD